VGSGDNGSFEIVGTALRTKKSFRVVVKNSYAVRVRTTDSGGPLFEKNFGVTVSPIIDILSQESAAGWLCECFMLSPIPGWFGTVRDLFSVRNQAALPLFCCDDPDPGHGGDFAHMSPTAPVTPPWSRAISVSRGGP